MRKVILLFIVLGLIACKNKQDAIINTDDVSSVSVSESGDNPELTEIYRLDQADRQVDHIDWSVVAENDRKREKRIYEILEEGGVRTSNDYQNAAMIFQHGGNSEAYGMAVKLMTKSIELNPHADKWLLAAATDRYLLSKGEPQIYGTQFSKKNEEGAKWERSEMDSTQITDAQRMEYRVETLAQQQVKLRRMNLIKLSEFINDGNSIEDVLQLLKTEDLYNSEYDLSEDGINNFGYYLMRQDKNQDALKIFKINTEIYTNEYNTHDSYGECLLKLGDKKGALKAYKKSLKLNPNNTNAEEVIANIEKNAGT